MCIRDRKKVLVYDLEHEELPLIYGFDSKVPVMIFGGELSLIHILTETSRRKTCSFLHGRDKTSNGIQSYLMIPNTFNRMMIIKTGTTN